MTEIWIDAQLFPPSCRLDQPDVRSDPRKIRPFGGTPGCQERAIFRAAWKAGVVLMSKDSDFLDLLDRYGPPLKVIWITCGNTSNVRMRKVLKRTLPSAVQMLKTDETIVEIGDL